MFIDQPTWPAHKTSRPKHNKRNYNYKKFGIHFSFVAYFGKVFCEFFVMIFIFDAVLTIEVLFALCINEFVCILVQHLRYFRMSVISLVILLSLQRGAISTNELIEIRILYLQSWVKVNTRIRLRDLKSVKWSLQTIFSLYRYYLRYLSRKRTVYVKTSLRICWIHRCNRGVDLCLTGDDIRISRPFKFVN